MEKLLTHTNSMTPVLFGDLEESQQQQLHFASISPVMATPVVAFAAAGFVGQVAVVGFANGVVYGYVNS